MTRQARSVALTVAVGLLVASPEAGAGDDAALGDALRLADAGRLHDAAAELLARRRSPSVLFHGAELLWRVGQRSAALERYLSALVAGPTALGKVRAAQAGRRLTRQLAFPLAGAEMRRLADLDLGFLPEPTRRGLWHRLGLFFLREGDQGRAQALLARAGPRPGSVYLRGVIAQQQGRQDNARSRFAAARRIARLAGRAEVADLAALALARLALDGGALPDAIRWYGQILYGSPFFFRARQELAWVHLRRRDPAQALAQSVVLQAPLVRQHYRPDREVVEAAALLELCRVAAAKKRLALGLKRLKGDQEKLARFLRSRPDERLYYVEAMAAAVKGGDLLSQELVGSLLVEASFRQAFGVVRQLQRERRLLLRPEASALRRQLSDELDRRLVSAQQRAGTAVRSALARQLAELKDLRLRAQELQVDADGAEARLVGQRGGGEGSPRPGPGGRRKIAAGRQLTWPFAGEYWSDEIGRLFVDLASRCRRRSP